MCLFRNQSDVQTHRERAKLQWLWLFLNPPPPPLPTSSSLTVFFFGGVGGIGDDCFLHIIIEFLFLRARRRRAEGGESERESHNNSIRHVQCSAAWRGSCDAKERMSVSQPVSEARMAGMDGGWRMGPHGIAHRRRRSRSFQNNCRFA